MLAGRRNGGYESQVLALQSHLDQVLVLQLLLLGEMELVKSLLRMRRVESIADITWF